MTEEEIRTACHETIRRIPGAAALELAAVTDETELYGAGYNLDSLGLTELVAGLEDRFRIRITDEEYMDSGVLENFGAVRRFVAEKLRK